MKCDGNCQEEETMTENEKMREEMVNEFLICVCEIARKESIEEVDKEVLDKTREVIRDYGDRIYNLGLNRGRSERSTQIVQRFEEIIKDFREESVLANLHDASWDALEKEREQNED